MAEVEPFRKKEWTEWAQRMEDAKNRAKAAIAKVLEYDSDDDWGHEQCERHEKNFLDQWEDTAQNYHDLKNTTAAISLQKPTSSDTSVAGEDWFKCRASQISMKFTDPNATLPLLVFMPV